MNNLQIKVLTALLAVGGAVPPALAQQDPSDFILKAMFAKMSKVLRPRATKDLNSPPDPRSIIMFCPVGTPYDPGLRPRDPSKPQDAASVNRWFDQIPKVSNVFEPSGLTYSSIYNSILYFSNTPVHELSKEDQDKYNDLLKQLDPAQNDTMAKYEQFQQELWAAQDDLEDKRITNSEASPRKVQAAWGKFYPYEGKIAKVKHALVNLAGQDLSVWWQSLRDRMIGFKVGEVNYRTDFYPSYETWATGPGWNKWTFKSSEADKLNTDSKRDIEASAVYSAEKMSASLTAKYMNQAIRETENNSDTTISFMLKRVSVLRPWMDESVFTDTHWKYNDGYNKQLAVVSSGLPEDGGLADLKGSMPINITTIILAKDIKITGKWVKKWKEDLAKSLEIDGKLTYGPLTITANFKDVNTRNRVGSSDKDDEFSSDEGVQIVAFIGNVIPNCPTWSGVTLADAPKGGSAAPAAAPKNP
jgi:hypothetical protein